MTTSKSPRRVLQVAFEAACRALPAYSHKFSPKKFTQPQLIACLVLKEFLRLGCLGIGFLQSSDGNYQAATLTMPALTASTLRSLVSAVAKAHPRSC